MASRRAGKKPREPSAKAALDVETFLSALEHPSKAEILALRQLILAADPSIAEGIKWNAPSFRTSEYFATVQLRAKQGVQIILHLGAKTRATAQSGIRVADPSALLKWLAQDRASARFLDLNDIEAKRSAFVAVLREWILHV